MSASTRCGSTAARCCTRCSRMPASPRSRSGSRCSSIGRRRRAISWRTESTMRSALRQAVGRWAVTGPPVAYLLLLFAAPTLIMFLAAFRFPGDYGGLQPLVAADPATGHLRWLVDADRWREFFTLDNLRRFFTEGV